MKRLLLILLLLSSVELNAQGRGTPNTLVVKVDANGYLLVTSATQTNPITQGVFSSRVLKTDANGSLQVVLTGTVTPTYPMSIPASTCAAPSLGESGAATTGIAFTATPSILECIAGVAVETITSTIDTWTISHSITRGTITTDLPVRTDTVTWNNGAVTFTGWLLNVTDTNSASNSLLLDLKVGSTIFSVRKDGVVSAIRYDGSNSTGAFRYTGAGSALITSASNSISANAPLIDVAQTWNNAGVTFTGWKLVVTDTASAAASLLIDLQVGAGTSKFKVDKIGNLTAAGDITSSLSFQMNQAGLLRFGSTRSRIGSPADGQINFTNAAENTGIGIDVSTDAIWKWRDRAQTGGSAQEYLEQTAPAAGAVNTARIYAVDNGAGKTQLCAIFNTGAAQCFATQP